MLILYKLFCYFNYPIWVLILAIRRFKGKEHKLRYREKLGYCKKKRPKKDLIWINALGLGETEDDLQIFEAEKFAEAFTQFS